MVRVSGTPEKHVQAMLNQKAAAKNSAASAAKNSKLKSYIQANATCEVWESDESGVCVCSEYFLNTGFCKAKKCKLDHDLPSLFDSLNSGSNAPSTGKSKAKNTAPSLSPMTHSQGGAKYKPTGAVLYICMNGALVYSHLIGDVPENTARKGKQTEPATETAATAATAWSRPCGTGPGVPSSGFHTGTP